MNSKKAITLLILATLMMALVPFVPIHAAAITADQIDIYVDPDWTEHWLLSIQKGDTIRIVGHDVTAGATVNAYWDNAMKETFTEGSGKVASGTAKSSGIYSIKFVVPEGLVGDHYIWVKDVATGATASYLVTIAPKLTISPSSGLQGDKIVLTGYGYKYDADIKWKREITILFPDGLADAPSTKPQTNSLGTWTYTLTVKPSIYDVYDTWAGSQKIETPTVPLDPAEWIWDDLQFTVGASITLSISEGPVGSVVTITGRGFEKDETLTVDIGGVLYPCYIISGAAVRSDGRISTKVVIPDKVLVDEEPTKFIVTVKDKDGLPGTMDQNSATAKFTVDGIAEIKATPSYGTQGSQITVEGWNFTKISGTEVKVAFTTATTGSKTFKTDSKGYFKGTMTIPAIGSMDQTLEAEVVVHHIKASAQVRVGIMLVILTPDSGPSGAQVSVTGVGFEAGTYTVKIGKDEWFTGTTTGTISESKNVPTMNPGVYTITVIEDVTEIEVTATLTVTEKTKVALSPVMVPNEYVMTIEGWYFAENPDDPSLEFVLYNSTIYGIGSEWILDVTYSKTDPVIPLQTVVLELDEDWDPGYFKGKFTVPKEDSISIGSYTMNVTDGEGMFAQIAFQVVPKTTEITPRKQTFRIGETVAFNVESSFAQKDAYIKIMDPSGNQYWRTDAFAETQWTKVGDLMVYPFYQQTAGGNAMYLLEDAPLGIYTWKWYDKDAELLDSGTFTVAAATESLLGQQITDLNTAVTDLQTEISTVSTAMAGVQTQITNAINAANAAVQAANAATQAVNAVATTASAANTAATNAAAAATEARNAANGLTTLVYGAIGASLVAALAAIVSLMQISRRIAG